MAYIDNKKTLFFTTSPRTPLKMIPEIEILESNFHGRKWNHVTQEEFIRKLAESNYFQGDGSNKDLALSARDRINRAPKSLGFVDLSPSIQLTEPGKRLISGKRTGEVLLRQLLKFQLPSPYHKQRNEAFKVKPYLEIFRLIYELGTVSFDELMIFGMQLTHYSKFNEIIEKIRQFRKMKAFNNKNYKVFRREYFNKEIYEIYKEDIEYGNIKIRETKEESEHKYIVTKSRNLRDYADACFRYLRATGMVEISQRGKTISIMAEKKREVEFFLQHIDREPVFIDNEVEYKRYLFDSTLPILYSDDKSRIIEQISDIISFTPEMLVEPIEKLKDTLETLINKRKQAIINKQIKDLKEYRNYSNVMEVFEDIKSNSFYDTPLMLEWNTWRAMTMLDGGNIKSNLVWDDDGKPMHTALGNIADITCDYGEFGLTVEVTMCSGHKQYEMEGESVARHLAVFKKETGKKAYCLFIAPKINESCVAYFYSLHMVNISYYGGNSIILPLELDVFINMVEQSYKAGYTPNADQIKSLFDYSFETAKSSVDEKEWYANVKQRALNWIA